MIMTTTVVQWSFPGKHKRKLWYLHPAIYWDLGEVEQFKAVIYFLNLRGNMCIVTALYAWLFCQNWGRISWFHPCKRVLPKMSWAVIITWLQQIDFNCSPTGFEITRKAFVTSPAPTHSMRVDEYDGSNILAARVCEGSSLRRNERFNLRMW